VIAKRKPEVHANLTAAWTIGCLVLIAALAITVGVLIEAY